MPKRKTVQEKEIEAIITKGLDKLGREIIVEAGRNSKVSNLQKDHLRDSGNFRTKPYNVLTVSQNFYGKYNTPKGVATPKDRSRLTNTPMRNAIRTKANENVQIIVKDLINLLISPVVTKKK